MKKKVFLVFLIVTLGCLLGGCGNNEQLDRIETNTERIKELVQNKSVEGAEDTPEGNTESTNQLEEELAEFKSKLEAEVKNRLELEEQLKKANSELETEKEKSAALEEQFTQKTTQGAIDYISLKFTEDGNLYEITNSHPHLYTLPSCDHDSEVLEIPLLRSSVIDDITVKGEIVYMVRAENGAVLFSYETIGMKKASQ